MGPQVGIKGHSRSSRESAGGLMPSIGEGLTISTRVTGPLSRDPDYSGGIMVSAGMNAVQEVRAEYSAAERYEALIRVCQALSAHRDPGDLLRAMSTELQKIVPFDGIVVAQYAEQHEECVWYLCDGAEPPSSGSDLPPVCRDDDVSRWVYESEQAVIISSLAHEHRFPELVTKLRSKGLESLCVLPLASAHRKIGSLGVASRRAEAYRTEEVRFLSLVADQVALALDDALNIEAVKHAQHQLEHRNQRLQLLLEVSNNLVSNRNLTDLLSAILKSLRSFMACDGVAVALPGEDGRLRIRAMEFPNSNATAEDKLPPDEDTAIGRVFKTGKAECGSSSDPIPIDPEAAALGLNELCFIPLVSRERTLGVLALGRIEHVAFTQSDIEFLHLVASQVAVAVENAVAYCEIAALKDRLAQEKVYLEDEIRSELNFDEIVGRSKALKDVLQQLETVAPTDSTVLIYGETGTGKELIARAIHDRSSRTRGAFVKLNCAAIPTGLLESELFGHEKGAFTGAVAQRVGRFELASQGTVFLDEISEIPLELQPKLLRVLQEREFERLGSSKTLKTAARLIAATNQDLGEMVAGQRFRADLFYRLNVFPLHVPSLRERKDDIPLLVRHFVQAYARRMNRAIDTIPSDAMNALCQYHWPGNVRELQNLIERAVILSAGPVLRVPLQDLQGAPAPAASKKIETLEESERRHILDALDTAGWVIAGEHGAAALLGVKRSTLQSRMEKLGIRRAKAAG